MPEAILALGGNLGDPAVAIDMAFTKLEDAGIAIRARSGLYRTLPWGPVRQPDYLNACAIAETALGPRELLAACQAVETALARERTVRWGPRTIDIDIVDLDGAVLDEPGLALPHPRFQDRGFVLVPLLEIAPDRILAGRPVRDWAAAVDQTGIRRI